MTRRYVYLAGPISGLTYDEATDWRENDTFCFDIECSGFTPLSPMRGKEQFRDAGRLASTFENDGAAVARDLYDIRRSDVVLVNLLHAKRVSIGTMCELGYAHALAKFIIVVMNPTVLKDNRGLEYKADALHDHLFVHELASQVVPTLDDALSVLERL